MEMLRLENIGYRYKNALRPTLDNVSCAFTAGTCHAIVGPSGSGKTTLLSIMAGLDSPQSGDIYLEGQNLKEMDLDQYRRERISLIFQAFQLFPLLTAIENVCYAMELCGVSAKEAKERAADLLEAVGIDQSKHKRYPSNLSGGEQQRVAIARALSGGGKIIFADEPTGNLDQENGDRVMEILYKLAREAGYCIIIVTHDLDIAAGADKVFRMKDGRLVEEGG